MPPSIVVIANPAAGRGRAARVLPRLRELAARAGISDVRVTRAAGDERLIARQAAAEGVETLVALGGDGTWGKVAQGILDSGRSPRLAVVAGGTGNDLAFSTGVPAHDAEAMVRVALGTAERAVDVGVAAGLAFLNVAGFGIEAEVLGTAERLRWLRGHSVYVAAGLRHLFTYAGVLASCSIDGDGADAARTYMAIVVSNGPRFGGGFVIAPGASVTDGALDVVRIVDTGPLRRGWLFARAMTGGHIGAREVTHARTTGLTLCFASPPLIDVDGELARAQSADVRIDCLPGRLRLAV